MKHPFVGKAIYFYLGVWTVFIAAHMGILYTFYPFSLSVIAADAVAFNILIAGLGLSYWYVVQYIPGHQGVQAIIFTHLAGVLVSVSLIVFAANLILKIIFTEDVQYQEFLGKAFLWRMIIGVFSLALIVMIYYLLRYYSNLKQKERDELELQNMLRHAELEMLKFQLNPHFIFNSLNSVSSLTMTAPEKARDMVISLSEFLRFSLGKKNADMHSLKEELEQMKLYLEIEKIRFGERLDSRIENDSKCNDLILPNMILQPLYENAIKYGVYEQLGEVAIVTTCTCDQGNLKISVSNSYDSEGVAPKGKGIGLKNVQNRLELIYGKVGLVTIEKNRTTFAVHLLIPQPQNDD